jgi:hypothetical protein
MCQECCYRVDIWTMKLPINARCSEIIRIKRLFPGTYGKEFCVAGSLESKSACHALLTGYWWNKEMLPAAGNIGLSVHAHAVTPWHEISLSVHRFSLSAKNAWSCLLGVWLCSMPIRRPTNRTLESCMDFVHCVQHHMLLLLKTNNLHIPTIYINII